MYVAPHPLDRDFPGMREPMRRLCQTDPGFVRQVEQYEALDKRISRIESGSERLDDLALQALKHERVILKDGIAKKLGAASGGPGSPA